MTNVHGIHPSAAPRAIEPAGATATSCNKVQSAGIKDVVEISNVAKLAAKVHDIPDVRTELVQRIKAEIAAGTYETPERLEIALDRLMDDLLG